MKAVWMDSPGEADVLYITELASPPLLLGAVRIDVKATALNRADLLQRRGLYPPPRGESEILGLEVAGVVSEVAADVTDVAVGERVCALLAGGGYATEAIVPAGMLMRLPEAMSFEEGAAIPEAFLTAYSNLVWLGKLQANARVLIHAGASGVGTAAIQLVRAFGASAIVTAGTPEKRAFCLQLGASHALDYKTGPFAEAVRAWSAGSGVDIILDFIGAPYLEQNLQSLAVDGRVIIVGTMGGSVTKEVDLGLLLRHRLQILGTALRSRSREQKLALTAEFERFSRPLFAAGTLRPVIDRVFPFEQAADAHRYMESNQNSGKIILTAHRDPVA